jgi:hypothetical protein
MDAHLRTSGPSRHRLARFTTPLLHLPPPSSRLPRPVSFRGRARRSPPPGPSSRRTHAPPGTGHWHGPSANRPRDAARGESLSADRPQSPILDQQGARHIRVNPHNHPKLCASPRTEDAALRRAEETSSNEQRPAGPVLSLWTSESEADAPGFVEQHHCRRALLQGVASGRLGVTLETAPVRAKRQSARFRLEVPGLVRRARLLLTACRAGSYARKGNAGCSD